MRFGGDILEAQLLSCAIQMTKGCAHRAQPWFASALLSKTTVRIDPKNRVRRIAKLG